MPRKSAVRLTDHLNMTIVVDWDVKPQNKQNEQTSDAQQLVLSAEFSVSTKHSLHTIFGLLY